MSELWDLVWGKPEIDPTLLAKAVEIELHNSDACIRTRILMRESLNALEHKWGNDDFEQWVRQADIRDQVETLRAEELEEGKFQTLRERLRDRTSPEQIRLRLQRMGGIISEQTRLILGSTTALILMNHLNRALDDIDVIDLNSHSLPAGWTSRMRFLDKFSGLEVYLVDVYDIFAGKLFSNRCKDMNDLLEMADKLEIERITNRLLESCSSLLSDERLRKMAEENWYILYGTTFPTR